MTDNPEVLIVGGGPVGLSAALALGRAGITCLVLERRTEFSRYPKANGVHARTMEIFREWEVVEPVKALTAGMPNEVTIAWMTRLAGIEIGQLVLGESAELARVFDQQSPEKMSTVGQHMFEPVLAEIAGDLDSVTIELGCEVVDLTAGEDSVTATYTDRTGARNSVVAQYVIGADGIRSAVRRTLGIGEHGEASLGTAINVQFDADLDPVLGGRPSPIIWIINADTQGAFIRDGFTRWRYNFEIPPGADPEAVSMVLGSRSGGHGQVARWSGLLGRRRRAPFPAAWRLRDEQWNTGRAQPGLETDRELAMGCRRRTARVV